MTIFKIARGSLLNRKGTTFLTIMSLAISVVLLLGIERIRSSAKTSFESTISGVDLIVGARSGPINLLLYSVFRIGNATNNLSYESVSEINRNKNVKWSIPISLGDSHKGFRVVGTNQNFFEYYKYSGDRHLEFESGRQFSELFDVVLGADVAGGLSYDLGDSLILSHGVSEVAFQNHANKPFTVVGILKKTGTPVDQSLHVSLEAIEALHVDWTNGAPPLSGNGLSSEKIKQMDLTPTSITALFVKLKSRIAVFNTQRFINNYDQEALMAILPGVTLRELWQTVGIAEKALVIVSAMVFVVSLMGMVIALLSTLNERRREMAVFRSIGAKKSFVFSLLVIETSLLSIAGIISGIIILYTVILVFKSTIESRVGLNFELLAPTPNEYVYLAAIFVGSLIVSVIPAWQAYRNSLADGLVVRN